MDGRLSHRHRKGVTHDRLTIRQEQPLHSSKWCSVINQSQELSNTLPTALRHPRCSHQEQCFHQDNHRRSKPDHQFRITQRRESTN